MSPRVAFPARHRAARRGGWRRALRSTPSVLAAAIRTPALIVAAAVAVSGLVVGTGLAATPGQVEQASLTYTAAEPRAEGTPFILPWLSPEQLAERRDVVSRSQSRADQVAARKRRALTTPDGPAVTRTHEVRDPRAIARALLDEYGFSSSQFGCLNQLWISESNWNMHADNPTSSAYGVPQAMTSIHDLPANYYTSAEAQIRWGLQYIKQTYGTPCAAWEFKQSHNWY